MKVHLVFNKVEIGEIFLHSGSIITREFKGLLIPNEKFIEIRPTITKYNEIFNHFKSSNLIDKTLDNLLKKKYSNLKEKYSQLAIKNENDILSNSETKILINDNLMRTGLGNPIINVESWNLQTNKLTEEFVLYQIEFPYPSSPNQIIEIKKKNELILEY